MNQAEKIVVLEQDLKVAREQLEKYHTLITSIKKTFFGDKYWSHDDSEILVQIGKRQAAPVEGAPNLLSCFLEDENRKLWHLVRVSLNDPRVGVIEGGECTISDPFSQPHYSFKVNQNV